MKKLFCSLSLMAMIFMFSVVPLQAATINVPGDYATIQAAIDDPNTMGSDIIVVEAGTHNVTTTIIVNKGVTITGPTGGGAIVQGTNASTVSVFEITTKNATIQNLEITHSALTLGLPNPWAELPNSLIRIPDGTDLSGIKITNNKIYVPLQPGPMSTWNGVAITVGKGTGTGISIKGNAVYNTRNGVVVHYNNIATISDNVIHNTKGGIMNYTCSQDDADNRDMNNNTWGTVHNEWDIVWNSGCGPYEPDYNKSVLLLSGANNDAYVISKMTTSSSPTLVTGNRSHIFVNAVTGTTTPKWDSGNMNLPYKTITLGIQAVVPGGKVYVAAGTYNEVVNITKAGATLSGAVGAKIQPDNGTALLDAGMRRPAVYVNGVAGVTVQGFEIDGSAGDVHYGVYALNANNTTVKSNTIHDLKNGAYDVGGNGILLFGWDQAIDNGLVEGNLVYNTPRMGIFAGAMDGTSPNYFILCNNITIKGNTVYNAWQGPTSDGGGAIQMNAAKNSVIEGNIIHDVPATWFHVGIYLNGSAQGNSITSNDVYATGYGIIINSSGLRVDLGSETPTAPEVYLNKIHGNSNYGLYNYDLPLSGTCNWWGSETGPNNNGNPGGLGDRVSSRVTFYPWLLSPPGKMYSFIIEEAKIDFKKKPDDDKIHVKGSLQVISDACSNGVNISEDVTVTIGPYSEMINMESKDKGKKWEYKRPKGANGIKDMKIEWKGDQAKFDIHVDDLANLNWENPVTISIQIGDDKGSEIVEMRMKKDNWDYHK